METTIVKRTSIEGKIINPENHNLRTLDDSNSSLYNPCDETLDEDPDNTMNSDCNITVIHVPLKTNNNNDSTSSDTKYEDDINNTSLTTTAIELDKKDYSNDGKDSKDGSDSGVEGCAIEVPRIQSRNSVDYASSCNGLDEASCDSSLASYCSVYEDPCGGNLPEDFRLSNGTVGEGTSEAGSESSSLAGSIQNTSNVTMTRSVKLTSVTDNCNKIVQPKKKVLQISTSHGSSLNIVGSSSISIKKTPRQNALTLSMTTITSSALTTTVTTTNSLCSSTITSRARAAISRTQSNAKDRGRSRDPGPTRTVTASTVASRSRSRPSTLPSALTSEINRDLAQRSKINATSKTNKVVISSTKSHQTIKDDSINRKSTLTSVNHKPSNNKVELKNFKSFDKMSASSDSRTLDTYATLPRSKHKLSISKVVDKSNEKDKLSLVRRSRSGSRDASLSRHLGRRSLLPKEINSNLNRTKESLSPTTKEKLLAKTKIYHEISIQTGITGEDIENVLAGVITTLPNPESVEKSDKETETEGSWEELQSTKADLKRVSETANELKQENDKLKSEIEFLKQKLSEEKSDHQFVRTELDKKNQRVMAMLGTPQSEQSEANDSFLELENHLQSSGQVLANQQVEISDLQALCRMLKRDLEKSIAAHDLLLQQQQEMESESAEIQDFLQEEKAALETALRDTEAESKKKDDLIKQLSSDLERQTEECKHLVRISEQRRQENLSISMRLNAIERKTRELLLGQGATVSGASVALSGLSSRLEGLVDQLINSYNISAKDLEDVIYHNEAFSRSNSSIDSSPVSSKHSLKDHTPSPKRGSFVSAIIGAIRNAATNSFTNLHNYENTASSISRNSKKEFSLESSTDILDETEPCLMMENVLEDVPLLDTYSHNMISSCDSLRRNLSVPETMEINNLRKIKINGESSSLNNLTQAILDRRKVEDEEDETKESANGIESETSENYMPANDISPTSSLLDQVIDVDNFVTKLLKVLRIIQLENDVCIEELKDEKIDLEQKLELFQAEKQFLRKLHNTKEILTNGLSEDHNNCNGEVKKVINNGIKDITENGINNVKNLSYESKDQSNEDTETTSPNVIN